MNLKFLINSILNPRSNSPDNLNAMSLTEAETIRSDIDKSLSALDRAWTNFSYAKQEYIDIAIMEIYLEEMKLSILIKKFKILTGEAVDMNNCDTRFYQNFFWLQHA